MPQGPGALVEAELNSVACALRAENAKDTTEILAQLARFTGLAPQMMR